MAHQDQDQDQDQQQDQDQELNQDQNDPAAATAIRAMWDRRPPSFAAAAAPVSRIHGTVFEGALPRDHRDHAACAPNLSWCVPSAVHQKLVTAYLPKVGGERAKADRTLLEWYVVVWANLPADTVIGDAFRFWTPRFEAQFGTTQAPPTARPGEQRSAVPGVEATREYMRRLKEQAQ